MIITKLSTTSPASNNTHDHGRVWVRGRRETQLVIDTWSTRLEAEVQTREAVDLAIDLLDLLGVDNRVDLVALLQNGMEE
jgi:hypothetical protein